MRKFRLINKHGINENFSNLVFHGVDVNDIDTKLRKCEFNAEAFLEEVLALEALGCIKYHNWEITFTSDDLIKLKGKEDNNSVTLYIEKE